MISTTLQVSIMVALSAWGAQGYAQTRSGRSNTRNRARDAGVSATAPTVQSGAVTVNGGPSAPAESVSAPVAHVDGMMRRMRVWLFMAPANATAFGLGNLGQGYRLWALLPSCRPADPNDPRDPCPVDRVVMESVGSSESVRSMDPMGIAPGADARRVQSFVVPQNVSRVRIKLMGPNARVRYEAIVEAVRLVDLPPPAGSPSGAIFNFDFTQYPAR